MQALPLKDISTFVSRWCVHAVVQKKEPVKTFNGKNGPGKILNLVLRDEAGDEITAKIWNNGIDVFEKTLEEGTAYKFSKGRVNLANKRYTTVPHSYEITFDENSLITKMETSIVVDKTKKYHQHPGGLRGLHTSQKELPFNIDLIGVLVSSGGVDNITSKAGAELMKRDIYVADGTGHKIQVSIWGETNANAESFITKIDSIIGIKGMRITEYKGKKASCYDYSNIEDLTNTSRQDVDELQTWWREHGKASDLVNLMDVGRGSILPGGAMETAQSVNMGDLTIASAWERLNIAAPNEEDATGDLRAHWFNTIAYLTKVNHTYDRDGVSNYALSYLSCQTCAKKITEMGCMTCTNSGTSQRYMATVGIADDSASRFNLKVFHGPGSNMLRTSADDAYKNKDDEGYLTKHFHWIAGYRPFKLNVKSENKEYQGVNRMQIQIVTAVPLDYEDEADVMLNLIEKSHPSINEAAKVRPVSQKREEYIPLPDETDENVNLMSNLSKAPKVLDTDIQDAQKNADVQ